MLSEHHLNMINQQPLLESGFIWHLTHGQHDGSTVSVLTHSKKALGTNSGSGGAFLFGIRMFTRHVPSPVYVDSIPLPLKMHTTEPPLGPELPYKKLNHSSTFWLCKGQIKYNAAAQKSKFQTNTITQLHLGTAKKRTSL